MESSVSSATYPILRLDMENTQQFDTSYYRGRRVFLTGATGFVGCALLSKLIVSTPCEKVVALVRGGDKYVHKRISTVINVWFADSDVDDYGASSNQLCHCRRGSDCVIVGVSML